MGVRFAEPDGKMEKSPGRLDSMTLPVAATLERDKASEISVTRQSDHFALHGATSGQVLCAESTHPVMAPDGKGRRPTFYARWQPTLMIAGTPALTLDLVPTGKAGEVRVYFRGQPLGGVKATLISEQADTELTADADGFLRFEAKTPGQYLLTLGRHSEPLVGFHAGKAYTITSHNAALTWRHQ